MFVSHSCRFVVFPDPLGACPWMARALQPWLDQPVAADQHSSGAITLFDGMTPAEAELAFDIMGMPFRNYVRIAIVRNPYLKMSQLYDRIADTDRVWQLRRRLGASDPDFARWLRSTRADHVGAGHRTGPRWRRFGAWSAKEWCGDHITHIARAEFAKHDLTQAFKAIGICPAFGGRASDANYVLPVGRHYDSASTDLIRKRYDWDLSFYEGAGPHLRLVA
ncbi:hypothetical protein [Yoonia sp.]|uniref:hypothetical protein n=1 Tax=Yoonia sp. TaxID=2212373 RepID=UPI0025E81665|nr:hypothetical protein [Yoonia sp.]